jgi:ATP-binding cassette subfamily F protein 3
VISQEKDIRMGFLRQDIFEQGRTVLEEAYEAFTEIKIVEKKLEEIIIYWLLGQITKVMLTANY